MPTARLPGDIPVLRSRRLRLRGHRPEDFEVCAAMWGDPLVTRFIGGRPSSPEEVWGRMLRYAGLWAVLGFGYWAIEDEGGDYVGDLGFADFRRDMTPSMDGLPEMGWALAARAQGKGYASEAVAAALAWGDAAFAGAPTACIIDPDNMASIRVAEKNGFREVARTEYRGDPTILYRRGG